MTPREFAEVAQALQAEAVRLGLRPPAFRSPCTVGNRSLRRFPRQVVVLVTHKEREPYEVTEDMIEGLLRGQDEVPENAREQFRSALWIAAGQAVAA